MPAGTIHPMSRRSWSTRFALWAAVCALVLKAAVPMFAAGAAGMRGVAVAEVCPVYGVALPTAAASQDAHHDHAHHGEHTGHAGHEDHSQHEASAHGGDHCALTALAALAVPDMAAPAVVALHQPAVDLTIERGIAWRDASAAWIAGLKHGPPTLA